MNQVIKRKRMGNVYTFTFTWFEFLADSCDFVLTKILHNKISTKVQIYLLVEKYSERMSNK